MLEFDWRGRLPRDLCHPISGSGGVLAAPRPVDLKLSRGRRHGTDIGGMIRLVDRPYLIWGSVYGLVKLHQGCLTRAWLGTGG